MAELSLALRKSFISPQLPVLFFSSLSLSLGVCWQAEAIGVGNCIFFGIVLIFATFLSYKNSIKSLLWIIFCFLLGSMRTYQQENKMRLFEKKTVRAEYVDGTVLSFKEKYNSAFRYEYLVSCNNIKQYGYTEQKIYGTFVWYVIYPIDILVGDMVRIYSPSYAIQKDSSFRQKLLKNNYQASLFSYSPTLRLLIRPEWSIRKYIHEKKNSLKQSINTKMSPTTGALFDMLFLGAQSVHIREAQILQKSFLNWGISHYLARSGLHVALFIVIINFILSLCMIPYRYRYILLGFILSAYTFLSWTSISFIRALTTFMLCLYAILQNIPLHTFHVFCLTYFLITCSYPFQIFSLDFQLSFALTFGLIWLNDLRSRKIL